jgi:transcriptional regulator with XRE-family HTH domain
MLPAAAYNSGFVGSLAENLRRERKQAGLTQRVLAEKAGVTELTIIKMELGQERNPKLRTIRRIARVLGVSYDRLIPPPDEPL